MAKNHLPNWEKYWENFSDLEVLREKANNLDETLRLLEKEFAVKLMSGDHMQIIAALEERIDELERRQRAAQRVVQTDLFDQML